MRKFKTTFAFIAGAASVLALEAAFLGGMMASIEVNRAKNDALDELKDADIASFVRQYVKERRN